MEKLTFDQHIQASREKVWDAMIGAETYKEWTAPFNASGSFYEGTWALGEEIRFYGPEDDGTLSGMIGKVTEHAPNEATTVTYSGQVMHGKEDFESDIAKAVAGASERYVLAEADGGTDVHVELAGMEMPEEIMQDMASAWPKALLLLKEIAERA